MVTILWDLHELPVSKINLVAMVTKIKMAASLSLSGKVDFPSIFDADSEEEADSDEEYRRHIKEDTGPSLLPLQEAVSEVPRTFQDFLDILLPRIRPKPNIPYVSLEDQQSLVNVVCGEIANQFSTLQLQASDPFLSAAGNKELHCRIIIKVIGIIEHLFSVYLAKACELSKKDILFSASSSMSRLRAQLSVDLSKSINLVIIRRRILEELNKSDKAKIVVASHDMAMPRGTGRKLTDDDDLYKPLRVNINSAQVKKKIKKLEHVMRHDAPLTKPKVPRVRTAGTPTFSIATDEYRAGEPEDMSRHSPTQMEEVVTNGGNEQLTIQRSVSMPELRVDFLFRDMRLRRKRHKKLKGVSKEEKWEVKRHLSVESLAVNILRTEVTSDADNLVLGECTLEQLNSDLITLASRTYKTVTNEDLPDDLPPLLLAKGHGLSDKKAKELQKHINRNVDIPEPSIVQSQHSVKQIPFPVPVISEIPPTRSVSIRTSDTRAIPEVEGSPMPDGDSKLDEPSVGQNLSIYNQFPVDLGLLTASGVSQSTHQQLSLSIGYQSSPGDDSEYRSNAGSLQSGQESNMFSESHDVQQGLGDVSGYSFHPDVASDSSDVNKMSMSQFPPLSDMSYVGGAVQKSEAASSDREEEPSVPEEDNPDLPQPQPDVLKVTLPNKESAMVSDISVSERRPCASLTLKPHGPVCEGLNTDIPEEEVAILDQVVKQGRELHHVYEAIGTTLQHDHVRFDHDPCVLSCIEEKVFLDGVLASGTLCHRHSRRIINPSLHQPLRPPWGDSDKKEWLSGQYYSSSNKETSTNADTSATSGSFNQSRANKTLWQSTINTEDYFRFVAGKQSDYLGLIYHLYNSDSDSEEEEIMQKRRKEQEIRMKKLKERKMLLKKLQQEKEKYEKGFWNIKTITMGGLGQPPSNPFKESDDQVPSSKTPTSFPDLDSNYQSRLDVIWSRLEYPQSARMDMAVKYSSEQYRFRMENILELWESACEEVETREEILVRLEKFEETFSRPNRFFKGPTASAAHRLQEAKERAKLLQELDKASKALSHTLYLLRKKYNDVLLLKGLPYSQKMKKDQTEMLYSLQQDRRADKLESVQQ